MTSGPRTNPTTHLRRTAMLAAAALLAMLLPAVAGAYAVADSQKPASGGQTWIAEANVRQKLELVPISRWGHDYLHARYYSNTVGRFVSVDPKGGSTGNSQSWNRYSYVRNNPLKGVDPNGEDLYIVYDFRGSGLSSGQQERLMQGVRAVYTNAGVDKVYSLQRGSSAVPGKSELGAHDSVVRVRYTQKSLDRGGSKGYGVTNPGSQKAVVSTQHAPAGKGGMNFLVNVTSHEVGHGSQALPQYDFDAAPPGTPLHPDPADRGTTMETGLTPEELAEEVREFSEEDAEKLREKLNINDLPNGG